MPVIKQELLSLLAEVSAILTCHNCHAYIVGGFVRDCLLDRETSDVDITVDADVFNIAKEVAEAVGGKYVLLDEANKVTRVMLATGEHQKHIDFTSFSDGIENDLARRDFTIDAMAIELQNVLHSSFNVIDPFCGGNDLNARLVRSVSQEIFKQDAARLLRAVRLAAELDFKIEPGTESLIRRSSGLTGNVAGERLREEFLRLLSVHGSAGLIRYVDELALLTELVPELNEMKGVEQPKEQFWNVFDHSVETVAAVEFLLRENDWEYGNSDLLEITPWSEEISRHFDDEVSSGSNRRQLLKLGGLLHDVAKPMTKTIDDTGRMRFLGHTKQGAIMTAAILNRLRFSSREVKLVETLVYHHLHPFQMSNTGLPTNRAIYRYFRDTGTVGIDVIFLALADYLAVHGPRIDIKEWRQHNQLMNYILAEHTRQQAKILPVKLIDGCDIMSSLGLRPGPFVGELLTLVREAQAAGEVNNRDQAMALVRREAKKKHCGSAC